MGPFSVNIAPLRAMHEKKINKQTNKQTNTKIKLDRIRISIQYLIISENIYMLMTLVKDDKPGKAVHTKLRSWLQVSIVPELWLHTEQVQAGGVEVEEYSNIKVTDM